MSVQLNRYHEDLITDADAYDVTVQVETDDGHAVDVGATVEDGVATITSLAHADRDELPRGSFPAAVEAVAELRDRGYDVDVGPLAQLVERQQESGTTEAPDTDSDADADADDGVECDVDGCDYAGSKRGLAIHRGRAHSEDSEEESDQDEDGQEDGDDVQDEETAPACHSCGEPLPKSWEDADGDPPACPSCGDNPLPAVGGDGESTEDVQEEPDLPEWLAENPTDVMADVNINRSLDEVLREVESQEDIIQVHQRLATGTLGATKELLARLGLTAPGDNDLINETKRATRVPIVRAVARDDDE